MTYVETIFLPNLLYGLKIPSIKSVRLGSSQRFFSTRSKTTNGAILDVAKGKQKVLYSPVLSVTTR